MFCNGMEGPCGSLYVSGCESESSGVVFGVPAASIKDTLDIDGPLDEVDSSRSSDGGGDMGCASLYRDSIKANSRDSWALRCRSASL